MSNPCQCGKPAHDGVLCPQCGDDLRNRLRLIADRWTDLEAALTSSEPGGEKGRTKNGMIEVGTTLNEAAVKALKELVTENYGELRLNIDPDSIYTGALGGATFAWRAVMEEGKTAEART